MHTNPIPFAEPSFDLFEKIGILDPEGLRPNPLTGRPYANLHASDTSKKSGKPRTYAVGAADEWSHLGVYERYKDLLPKMKAFQIVCAKSGTGSGKTVIFPKFALHVGGYKKKVLCAIPKRDVTKSGGTFAAKCLDVELGKEVGYFYRGEDEHSPTKSMLTFTTTGSVIARLKRDPLLSDYGYLVIDEAHERTTSMDLLLLFVKEMVQKRADIKVVIMSATIDPAKYRAYFSGVPGYAFSFVGVEIDAKAPFPRTIRYRDPTRQISKSKGLDGTVIAKALVEELTRILDNPPLRHDKLLTAGILDELKAKGTYKHTANPVADNIVDGDIIVFVPGGKIALKVKDALAEVHKRKQGAAWAPYFCTKLEASSSSIMVPDLKGRPIYQPNGKTANENYYATDENAFRTHPDSDPKNPFTRKIVITTDVAESSVTIDGATYVIDSGVKFGTSYSPATMANTMGSIFVAKDAIEQRQGRVGRTNPGVCYHLYTEEQHAGLRDTTIPGLCEEDLTANVLEIMSMAGKDSVADVRAFFGELMEPPKEAFVASAFRTLHSLGAITSTAPHGRRNMFGRAMSYFRSPITPAQAKCLILSKFYNCSREMAQLVALVDACRGKELVAKMLADEKKGVDHRLASQYGDHLTMLHAYQRYAVAKEPKTYCKAYNLKPFFFANVEELSAKILGSLDILFDREDDLLEVDESLVLDETNMASSKKKKKPKPKPKPPRPGDGGGGGGKSKPSGGSGDGNTSTSKRRRRGGTFHVTDGLRLTAVNASGRNDLAILYALYPDCQNSVPLIAAAILKQHDPHRPASGIDAEKAQTLLTGGIQRYNPTAFAALSAEQQKALLAALDQSIALRDLEHTRAADAIPTGATATAANAAEARGHHAWLHNLRVFRGHVLRKLNRDTGGATIAATRKRVAEELYQHIEDMPADFYDWDNVEDRLMRVLFEGYCVQSGVRMHPNDKTYHSAFPQKSTEAPLSETSTLQLFRKRPADVCLFEQIFTIMTTTSFATASTLPPRVRRNAEVCRILRLMTRVTFPRMPQPLLGGVAAAATTTTTRAKSRAKRLSVAVRRAPVVQPPAHRHPSTPPNHTNRRKSSKTHHKSGKTHKTTNHARRTHTTDRLQRPRHTPTHTTAPRAPHTHTRHATPPPPPKARTGRPRTNRDTDRHTTAHPPPPPNSTRKPGNRQHHHQRSTPRAPHT
jgi:HrpA-like RNA helicase